MRSNKTQIQDLETKLIKEKETKQVVATTIMNEMEKLIIQNKTLHIELEQEKEKLLLQTAKEAQKNLLTSINENDAVVDDTSNAARKEEELQNQISDLQNRNAELEQYVSDLDLELQEERSRSTKQRSNGFGNSQQEHHQQQKVCWGLFCNN